MRRFALFVAMLVVPARAFAQQPSRDDVRSVLAPLIETYGVSGMEGPVREAVSRMLPPWASATTDSAGDLIVSVGEGEPLVVFVAHLDEIGFVITAIQDDGTLELKQRGGFFLSLFEAQPALVHTGERSIPGVFMPRDSAGATPTPHPRAVPRRCRRRITCGRRLDGHPCRSYAHDAEAVRAARRHTSHRALL